MRNPKPGFVMCLSLFSAWSILSLCSCAKHAAPPPTPIQQQTSGIDSQIYQINQNPTLSPAQKQQLIARLRASAPPVPAASTP